jgi:hypothetical protein
VFRLRKDGVTEIHLPVLLTGLFLYIRADIIHSHLFRADSDAQVTWSAEDGAVDVAILCSAGCVVRVGGTRLGDFLINNAVELLLNKEMVVPVKDGGYVISN